jgi:hypothetical protein
MDAQEAKSQSLKPSDLAYIHLPRAGWSIGDISTTGGTWLVIGSNGENVIHAEGKTADEAWEKAVQDAISLGIMGRWF